MSEQLPEPSTTIRQVMRRVPRVALGTVDRGAGGDAGGPYVSLAMVALDHDATPLLLLSDLADHTQNLKRDPRVSLLFDDTLEAEVPLAAARATIQGRIRPAGDERLQRRYVARHPDAEVYAGFRDFQLYAVQVERAHLVAGFGRIHWVEGASVVLAEAADLPLAEAESEIVAHMNADHGDAVQLYATALLGRGAGPWRLTGVDPEGADLRAGGTTARLPFDQAVRHAEGARVELVRLVKLARTKLADARPVDVAIHGVERD